MTMIIAFLGFVTIFVVWLFLDEEHQFRKTYRLLGTTGFRDVDERLRRFM